MNAASQSVGLGVSWMFLLVAAIGFLLLVLAGLRRPWLLALTGLGGLVAGVVLYPALARRPMVRLSPVGRDHELRLAEWDAQSSEAARRGSHIELSEAPLDQVHAAGTSGSSEAEASATESAPAEGPARLTAEADTATAARPAWMDAPMGLEDGVYMMRVQTDRFASPDGYNADLVRVVEEGCDVYVKRMLGISQQHAPPPFRLPYPYIDKHIVKEEWTEQTTSGTQGNLYPMYRVHALLKFDTQVQNHIRELQKRQQIVRRLGYTGASAGLLLGFLATAFGYLKLDTLTRGYYSRRLQLAAGAMILTEAAVAARLILGMRGI